MKQYIPKSTTDDDRSLNGPSGTSKYRTSRRPLNKPAQGRLEVVMRHTYEMLVTDMLRNCGEDVGPNELLMKIRNEEKNSSQLTPGRFKCVTPLEVLAAKRCQRETPTTGYWENAKRRTTSILIIEEGEPKDYKVIVTVAVTARELRDKLQTMLLANQSPDKLHILERIRSHLE